MGSTGSPNTSSNATSGATELACGATAFERRLSTGLLLTLALALALGLLNKGLALKLFELAGLLAVIGLGSDLLHRRHTARPGGALALLLLSGALLGASKWFWASHYGVPGEDLAKNNLESGKRILLALPIFWALYTRRERLGQGSLRGAAGILLVGLNVTLAAGLIEHFSSLLRVRLNTDAATTAAYLITVQGLATAVLIRHAYGNGWLSLALALQGMAASLVLLTLSGTRSAILLAPCLYLLVAASAYSTLGRRAWLAMFCVLLCSGLFAAGSSWERLSGMHSEWSRYGTDNNSSIGARISLWKAGLLSQTPPLWGQTVELRYAHLQTYLKTREAGNPEALRAIRYHLHNEFIDTLSLRGVLAAAILLGFYLATVNLAVAARSFGLLALGLTLILYGLSDVVLHQRLACLMVFLALALVLATLPSGNIRAAAAPPA